MALRIFESIESAFCTCPPKYVINPYVVCEHGCVYCYGKSFWKRSLGRLSLSMDQYPYPKVELVEKLRKEVRRKRKLPVLLSSIVDPYTPSERKFELTRRIVEILSRNDFPILIETKSNLVLRDVDLLDKGKTAICVSISTLDEEKAKRIEPNAPSPKLRMKTLEELSEEGFSTVLFLDPIIPYFTDNHEGLEELVKSASEAGVRQITFSTLRVKKSIFKDLSRALPELKGKLKSLYFKNPELRSGYYYAPLEKRVEIAKLLFSKSKEYELKLFGCRMGLPEYCTAKSGDGQDFLREKLKSLNLFLKSNY